MDKTLPEGESMTPSAVLQILPFPTLITDANGFIKKINHADRFLSSVIADEFNDTEGEWLLEEGEQFTRIFSFLKEYIHFPLHEEKRINLPHTKECKNISSLIIIPLEEELWGILFRIDENSLLRELIHDLNNAVAGVIQMAQLVESRLDLNLPVNKITAEKNGLSEEAFKQYLEERKVLYMSDKLKQAGNKAYSIINAIRGLYKD